MEEFELKQTLPTKRPLSPLESFSGDAINNLYRKLEEFQSISSGFQIRELLSYEEDPTLQGMGDVLDSTVAPKLGKEDPGSLAKDLKEDISKWNDQWKRVLKTVLLIKILNNEEYKKINPEVLKETYCLGYIEDLAFIWLLGLEVRDFKK